MKNLKNKLSSGQDFIAGKPVGAIASGRKDGSMQSTPTGCMIVGLSFLAGQFISCSLAWAQTSSSNTGISGQTNKTTSSVSSANSKASEQQAAIIERIKSTEASIELSPLDVSKRLYLARLWRSTGNLKQACIADLNATAVEPSCYVAYHDMLQNGATPGQIDEALDRLNKLEKTKPKQFLLRMSLSELYEHKNDYYQAARVLVDLQYTPIIPTKYVAQVDVRVHRLLSKTKDLQTTKEAIEHKQKIDETEATPSTPVPLPDVAVTKDMPTGKLRSSKVTEGYGHSQLLP